MMRLRSVIGPRVKGSNAEGATDVAVVSNKLISGVALAGVAVEYCQIYTTAHVPAVRQPVLMQRRVRVLMSGPTLRKYSLGGR